MLKAVRAHEKKTTMFRHVAPGRITKVSGKNASPCARQPGRSAPFVQLSNTLPSEPEVISPFVDELMQFIARFRDGESVDIELALREALANAIVHGNRKSPYKSVYVTCRCTTVGEVSITVQDEGQGFEIKAVSDPTDPEHRPCPSGRGIYLMKSLMDEVHFESQGTIVRMLKLSSVESGPERGTR